ncbi:hypothetical protein J6590_023438 [Homalodisca vitripennis]|nr:hypothetical protein J6590_023438 [Homalodisca vitripennis]
MEHVDGWSIWQICLNTCAKLSTWRDKRFYLLQYTQGCEECSVQSYCERRQSGRVGFSVGEIKDFICCSIPKDVRSANTSYPASVLPHLGLSGHFPEANIEIYLPRLADTQLHALYNCFVSSSAVYCRLVYPAESLSSQGLGPVVAGYEGSTKAVSYADSLLTACEESTEPAEDKSLYLLQYTQGCEECSVQSHCERKQSGRVGLSVGEIKVCICCSIPKDVRSAVYSHILRESKVEEWDFLIPKDVRSAVYSHIVREGKVEEWDFLWERYKNTNLSTEKTNIMIALTTTKEVWLLNRCLDWTLDSNSGIRKQESFIMFALVAKQETGFYVAQKFFFRNIKRISD